MSATVTYSHVFKGTAFYTPERHSLKILKDALIAVDTKGVIARVETPDKSGYNELLQQAENDGILTTLKKGQYLMPGMLDLHVHASQWPQSGTALHLHLYDWLQERTFPLEASYADGAFAEQVYSSLVTTLLANGTTTAVYFATIHSEASTTLAKVCLRSGQRALVGRVAMDKEDQCPDFYRDASPQESIQRTAEFVGNVEKLSGNEGKLVMAAVTPRFIPTCTDEAMKGLSSIAHEHGCYIQTHCSESDWEHTHVVDRFKKTDAHALDSLGLLTSKTILAHSNFIDEVDMDLLKVRGCTVAHCPVSNFYFANSVFPLKEALDRGVQVGLGTDLSGGYSPSVFDACRAAIMASRALEDGVDPRITAEKRGRHDSRVNHVEVYWTATASAGAALGLNVGVIDAGYLFDCIVVDVNAKGTNIAIFDKLDTDEDVFQKIVYNVTPCNIMQTWVNGKLVHTSL